MPASLLSAIAGLLVGRWWAVVLAVPMVLIFAPLYEAPDRQELNFLGWMLLGAVPTAAAQAALLAAGVGVSRIVRG